MKAILSILVLFGILAALPEDKTLFVAKKTIHVSASTYFGDYQANVEKANKKYRNRKVQITGKISDIHSACPDNPYVMVDGVECSLVNPSVIKSLSVGNQISLSGVGAGSAINIPFLTDCSCVKKR
jgi:hypothetical protein